MDHWTFTDSTGTEYRLDKQVDQSGNASATAGIWASSSDSATIVFDSNTRRLYFPNGIFRQFDSFSQGIEGDGTAQYPTLIQDTNGNQIILRYTPGVAAVDGSGNNVYVAWGNSSSRIDQIEDVRAISLGNYVTYQFNYNNDSGVPHLTSITNNIGTSEGYSFSYYSAATLTSPWGAAFGTTTKLSGIGISGVGLNYYLGYDTNDSYGSALTKVVFPYGGYIRWAYGDGAYNGSRAQKEVVNRYVSNDGSTETGTYAFTNTHDSINTMRQTVILTDAGPAGQKVWGFNTAAGFAIGLLAQYQGIDRQTGNYLQIVSPTWTSAPFGPYVSSTTTTMDYGKSYAVAKRVDQTIDQWGNLLTMTLFDYGGAVRRQFTNTYSAASALTSRYIRNRLLTATVQEAGVTTTMVTNVYDGYNTAIVNVNNLRQFDTSYNTAFTARGNLTLSTTLSGVSSNYQFDITGTVLQSAGPSGVNATTSTNASTNFTAPSSITVGSLTSTFSYAADLLPTQATGPNGDSTSTVYDSYARPKSSTAKTGAVTYFAYGTNQTLAYTNPTGNAVGRVSRVTLDGFGRTVKQEAGTGTYSSGSGAITMSTIVSTVDTQYAPCGCSPLGKLSQTSRPYAPGGGCLLDGLHVRWHWADDVGEGS